jgi:AcrR family transcriptional regulator
MSRDAEIDGRSRRANDRRENRRAEILRGALDVFGHKGYHQTSVADIIEAAGIARGTFYLYFDGKSAVFLELLDSVLAELNASIIGVETGAGSPPIQLQLVTTVRRILDAVVKNRLLANIVVREAVGLDAEVERRLRAFYAALLRYIEESLAEGRRLGVIRELDQEIAAMCVLGTIKQFVEQVVVAGEDATFDVDRMALAVLDFNLRGLLAIQADG